MAKISFLSLKLKAFLKQKAKGPKQKAFELLYD
jgi:hypothetical protein